MTHAGLFHADEVFATAMLQMINGRFSVKRVFKVPEDIDADVLVFDIGLGAFDHHQQDAALRPNGKKYAAFGLLWKEFSDCLCPKKVADIIDTKLVSMIDDTDNGEVWCFSFYKEN